jgi:NDP-sugar pyrophosphorylase family protein
VIRQAIVLTAGLGTRLRPLTLVRAKPAIPVAGTPMIVRIIRWLARAGVNDLVLNLHHLPASITGAVGDGSAEGVRVRYSWEPAILGSAGGPRRAAPLLGGGLLFIVNGDTLTDLDLDAMADEHHRLGGRVTLAVVPNRDPERYGGVVVDTGGAVTGFVRRGKSAEGSYHFVGVQLADVRVFDAVVEGTPAASIGGIYDGLIAENPGIVRAFVSNARFWDVGTAADYLRMQSAFAVGDGVDVGAGSTIDAASRVTRSILWEDVHVDAGCVLDECIVADHVRVPAGTICSRMVLVNGENGSGLVAVAI